MLFQSEDRWYRIEIDRDLFDLVVIRRWGGRKNKIHGERSQVVSSLAEATALANTYSKKRLKRGYVEINTNGSDHDNRR
ncbi:WGR domain-containing protein [Chitinibacter tainanensis]|uniref:WGR domain-containing protein n=1 Tax=Chitinibacter tainanensis TaxID=230667 RepID=UPI00055864F3|nr:WGR domain-containing protein [Chitinibacter tainanensis]